MTSPNHSHPEVFAAPRASTALAARLSIPGSKSLTNRELVLAALANGPSTIRGGLRARDTELMMEALRTLGATISVTTDGEDEVWQVTPTNFGSISDTPLVIDCGLAGTVMRFVPPMVLLGFQPVTFVGDEQAGARPMSGVIEGLRQLGAIVVDNGAELPKSLNHAGHGPRSRLFVADKGHRLEPE